MSGVYRCESKEKYFRTTVLILGAIIIAVFTIGIVMFITVFSKNNNISADLRNYVYNELPQIRQAEEKRAKLVDKFEEQIYSVGNEENEHLLSQIADATSEIIDTANKVNIKTEKLQDINKMYIDAMKMQYSAYLTLLEAYKDEDYNLIAEANDKFKEASENLEDYYSEMRLLLKQYRVKYGEETERK